MLYRIHRLKAAPKEHFRWAPHTAGTALVKPRDYEPAEEIAAASPYAVWKMLAAGTPLQPGDLLEACDENDRPLRLEIYKYIGFEPANWHLPEPKPEPIPNSRAEA